MDKIFHYKERNSTFWREILSGFIVFLAMCYILPVNQGILGACGGNPNAIFIATAICSGICCILMGLLANFPIALSTGMGMNAYLTFTVCQGMGYTFSQALLLVFFSGILFLILSLSPLRQKIISSIPKSLKLAVSAGLGGFICFVGLKSGGVITSHGSTFVALGDLSNPTVLLTLFGIVLCLCLMQLKNKVGKFAIVISMVITATIGVILGACGVEGMPKFDWSNSIGESFGAFGSNVGACFDKESWSVFSRPESYAVIFSLIFVNIFDNAATIIAVGKKVGIMNEEGEIIGGKKAMMADSIGAVICAPLGTSTVTAFAESTVGAEFGAKTGLSACTTGLLFLLSTLIYPVFTIFSGVEGGLTPVTSLALVSVGALMFKNIKDIEWDDTITVISTFLIIILMVLCYSISDGLGLGLIIYCLMMLVAKRGKEVSPVVYGVAIFFIIYYIIKVII